MYRKIENELNEKTDEIDKIVIDSRRMYEERDRLVERITSLKEVARREVQDFEHELRDLVALKEKNKSNTVAVATVNEIQKVSSGTKHSYCTLKTNAMMQEPEKVDDKDVRLKLDFAKLKIVSKTQNAAAIIAKLETIEEQNFHEYNSILSLAAEKENLDAQIAAFKKKKDSVAALAQPKSNPRKENIEQNIVAIDGYKSKNEELERFISELQGKIRVFDKAFKLVAKEFETPELEEELSLEEGFAHVEKQLLNLLVFVGYNNDSKLLNTLAQEIQKEKRETEQRGIDEFINTLGYPEESEVEVRALLDISELQTIAKRKLARFNARTKIKRNK